MNREELSALQDAIATILAWPPAVFDQVAAWLAPTAKPNGHDPHPPPTATLRQMTHPAPEEPPGRGLRHLAQTTAGATPRPAKARRDNAFNARTIELRLLAALRERPAQTAGALARSVGGAHTTVGRELKGMASRGEIEKDAAGLWRLAGEAAGPTSPSSATS
jgi:hypothetical protein